MDQQEARKTDAIQSLANRPGCLGVVGSILAVVLDFFRQLNKALATLTYEYESKRKFLGLPLFSINLGFDTTIGKMRHARGFIAIGTRATGVLSFGFFVSRGLIAIGGIALGLGTVSLFSIALISVSVFGLGIVSVSVFAIGYLAVGVFALGYKSLGILAIGKEVVGIIGIGQEVDSLFSP